MTGPLTRISSLCASPQGGISPAPLRTNRRGQLCVPTPISEMKLSRRATTEVSTRNQFPSRNPTEYSLRRRLRLRASLTAREAHSLTLKPPYTKQPVYLTIRLWAQPSTEPCACKGSRLPLPALGAHARSRARAVPRGLALPVRAPVAHRRPRPDVVPSVPLVLPPQLSKLPGLADSSPCTTGSARTRTR